MAHGWPMHGHADDGGKGHEKLQGYVREFGFGSSSCMQLIFPRFTDGC